MLDKFISDQCVNYKLQTSTDRLLLKDLDGLPLWIFNEIKQMMISQHV